MFTTSSARAGAFACCLFILAAAPPAAAVEPSGDAAREIAGLTRFGSMAVPSARDYSPFRVHLTLSRRARLTRSGHAIAPAGAPRSVRRMIRAANRIALTPYVYGGGHGSWRASGYDCSGSVGYALHGARLIDKAVTSGALTGFGRAGKGRWVTIYANGGHTYMTIAGLRFDTSAHGANNSRWTRAERSPAGYVVRHPAGL